MGLFLWPEARLFVAHEMAAFARRERASDHGLVSLRRLFARSVPAVGEPRTGFDDQDLAVGHAVPMWHGRGAKIEPVTNERL